MSARASDMKRSIPSSSVSPATGTVPVEDRVADSVTNPPPVTAAAPFEVRSSTTRSDSSSPSDSGVFVACATKTAAIVR